MLSQGHMFLTNVRSNVWVTSIYLKYTRTIRLMNWLALISKDQLITINGSTSSFRQTLFSNFIRSIAAC